MTIKRYYSLLVRDTEKDEWQIHFGDYSKRVVAQERKDICESEAYAKRNTQIVCTADNQNAIDLKVDQLNGNTLGAMLRAVPFEPPFVIVDLENPLEVHNKIADAIGEPHSKLKN